MTALSGIPGRAGFIAYAGLADTEDAALLFQQMAELIAGYSAKVAPVRQVAIVFNLPVITTAKGPALLLPIDRLLWTQRSAGVGQGMADCSRTPRRSGSPAMLPRAPKPAWRSWGWRSCGDAAHDFRCSIEPHAHPARSARPAASPASRFSLKRRKHSAGSFMSSDTTCRPSSTAGKASAR